MQSVSSPEPLGTPLIGVASRGDWPVARSVNESQGTWFWLDRLSGPWKRSQMGALFAVVLFCTILLFVLPSSTDGAQHPSVKLKSR